MSAPTSAGRLFGKWTAVVAVGVAIAILGPVIGTTGVVGAGMTGTLNALLPAVATVLSVAARSAVLEVAVGIEHPIVVLGVLQVILGGDAVAGRGGIARHGEIPLKHLSRGATHLHLGAGALVGVVTRRHVRLAALTATGTLRVGKLSHLILGSLYIIPAGTCRQQPLCLCIGCLYGRLVA